VSASTGPVVAAGLITVFNAAVLQGRPMDNHMIQTAIGTAVVAGGLSILENFLPGTAVLMGWVILGTVLLVRVDPSIPSPAESFEQWYQQGSITKDGKRGVSAKR
jgi:hypothetical protein